MGGNNRVPMADLRQVFERAGCSEVRTYIQSGSIVFSAPSRTLSGLAARLTRDIETCFGCRTPVVLRNAEEIARVLLSNPFLAAGADPKDLHVMFLADLPDAGRAAALDPQRSPPDTFAVCRQEVYLHLPNGAGKSKLTNSYFDSKLGTTSTSRNWRTVQALHELME